jgi:hypothetical protein
VLAGIATTERLSCGTTAVTAADSCVEGQAMRRFVPLGAVIIVLLLGLVARDARPDAGAQEATPATAAMEEGITAELLATGPVPAYPPLPAEIALYRLRIAPGGRIVTPGDDLALGLVAVESGTVVIRRTVAGVVTRGAVLATPGAQADEAVPANTEITLGPGDFYVAPPGSGGELRNDGTDEAIILDAVIASGLAATPTP